MPLGVIDLIEVKRDSLREVTQGFVKCAALASHIDLKTLRYVPVLFPVHRGGQVARCAHVLSVTLHGSVVVPPRGATPHGRKLPVADLEGERLWTVGLPQVWTTEVTSRQSAASARLVLMSGRGRLRLVRSGDQICDQDAMSRVDTGRKR